MQSWLYLAELKWQNTNVRLSSDTKKPR